MDSFSKRRLFLGILVLILFLYVSQLKDQQTFSESKIVNFEGTGSVEVTTIHLLPDDEIYISASSDNFEIFIQIFRSSKETASSSKGKSVDLNWICGDEDNYILALKFFNPGEVRFDYTVTRNFYHLPWAFPIGLIASGFIIVSSLGNDSLPFKKSAKTINFTNISNYLLNQLRRKELRIYIVLFAVSFLPRLVLSLDLLHNDEIGGGKLENWGYYAWGYVDTAKQIAELVKAGNYTFNSWFAVHNMSKPIFSTIFMAIFIFLFPTLGPLSASRLFVGLSGALTCVLIYWLCKKMFDRITGIFAALLLSFDPIFLHYSRAAYPEVPTMLFMVLFISSLYMISISAKRRHVLMAGLFFGATISAKTLLYIYPLTVLTIVWFIIANKKAPFINRSLSELSLTLFQIFFIGIAISFVHWPRLWADPLQKLWITGFFGSGALPTFRQRPTFLFGRVVNTPPRFVVSILDIIYQTTYLEIFGFVLFFSFLIFKRKRTISTDFLMAWFFIFFIFFGSSIIFLQHYMVYFILPYVVLSAVGYSRLSDVLKKTIDGGLLKVSRKTSMLTTQQNQKKTTAAIIMSLTIFAHLFVVFSVAPDYGLYYNKLFLLGQNPTDMFLIPEPNYGLVEIAEYIKSHPSVNQRVLTTVAPHSLQYLLPDYSVLSSHTFPWENDVQNLMTLKELNAEYVVVGIYWLQFHPNGHSLLNTLEKYGKLILTVKRVDITVAYLYSVQVDSLIQMEKISPCDSVEDWKVGQDTNSSKSTLMLDPIDLKEGNSSIQLLNTRVNPSGYSFVVHNPVQPWNWSEDDLIQFWIKVNHVANVTVRFEIHDLNGNWRSYKLVIPSANDWYKMSILLSKYSAKSSGSIDTAEIDRIAVTMVNDGTSESAFNLRLDDINRVTFTNYN